MGSCCVRGRRVCDVFWVPTGGEGVGPRRGEAAHLGVGEVRAVGAHQAGGGEPLDLLAERGRPRAAVAARGRTAAREEVVHDAPSLAAKRVDVRGGDGASPTRGVALERRGVRTGERTGVRTGRRGRRRGRHRARLWDVATAWARSGGPRRDRGARARRSSAWRAENKRDPQNCMRNSYERHESQTARFDWRRGFQVASDKISIRDLSSLRLGVGEATPPARASHTVRARLRTQTRYEQWRP